MARVTDQYQGRDYEIVDYQLYELPGVPVRVRGPKPKALQRGRYIACLGAAQTFGTLCAHPWPELLGQQIRWTALNLGFGGAGPAFFLLNPAIMQYANRSAVAIVQVLSARPVHNSYFDVRAGTNFLRPRGVDQPFLPGDTAYQRMLVEHGEEFARRLVAETRLLWTHEMELLLDAIRVPKILFWFSKRAPDYIEAYTDSKKMMGLFPQFVNRIMMDVLQPRVASYVECVTSRGSPQALVSRFTGESAYAVLGPERQPRSENQYYPSPEMHEDAVAALVPVLRELLPAAKV